jgi:ATP-binding cassette, subfamily B, bacterial
VVVIAAAVLLSSGLGIVTPFLTQAAFDRALFPVDGSGVHLTLLAWLVGGMVAVPVVSALIGVYQIYRTTLLGNSVMADLRGRLFGSRSPAGRAARWRPSRPATRACCPG